MKLLTLTVFAIVIVTSLAPPPPVAPPTTTKSSTTSTPASTGTNFPFDYNFAVLCWAGVSDTIGKFELAKTELKKLHDAYKVAVEAAKKAGKTAPKYDREKMSAEIKKVVLGAKFAWKMCHTDFLGKKKIPTANTQCTNELKVAKGKIEEVFKTVMKLQIGSCLTQQDNIKTYLKGQFEQFKVEAEKIRVKLETVKKICSLN